MELKKSIDQFVEKASKQVSGLVNEASPDAELQLRQLHSTIRSQAGGLDESGEVSPKLSTLSKTFNEYMQLLDKLNASFSLLK